MDKIDEYASIYWAAACLLLWAGCGVSDIQFARAIDVFCDDAGMSVPQEALLRKIIEEMKGG